MGYQSSRSSGRPAEPPRSISSELSAGASTSPIVDRTLLRVSQNIRAGRRLVVVCCVGRPPHAISPRTICASASRTARDGATACASSGRAPCGATGGCIPRTWPCGWARLSTARRLCAPRPSDPALVTAAGGQHLRAARRPSARRRGGPAGRRCRCCRARTGGRAQSRPGKAAGGHCSGTATR